MIYQFTQPLNLEQNLVNVLAGSVEVFTFLFILAISALAARFRMPTVIFGIMLSLFGVIMAQYIGGLYLIIILITGFLTFNAIANLFR